MLEDETEETLYCGHIDLNKFPLAKLPDLCVLIKKSQNIEINFTSYFDYRTQYYIMRSGLGWACANHEHIYGLYYPGSVWKQNRFPGNASPPPLWGDITEQTIQHSLYHNTFINPHLFANTARTYYIADGWLNNKHDFNAYERCGVPLDQLLNELNNNIGHCCGNDNLHSFISVSVEPEIDKGNLRILVMDTGEGLISTAYKIERFAGKPKHNVLRALIDGSHSGWGRQRGMGLPKVVRAVIALSGKMIIKTNGYRATVDKDIIVVHYDSQIDGTIIDITIPLKNTKNASRSGKVWNTIKSMIWK